MTIMCTKYLNSLLALKQIKLTHASPTFHTFDRHEFAIEV